MQCQDYDLLSNRDQIFVRLLKIWQEAKKAAEWDVDIWRKGNTLQAVGLYWKTAQDPGLRSAAWDMMLDAYDFYTKKKSGKWWVDDFGWWGGFFANQIDYNGSFTGTAPFDRPNLVQECRFVYSRMIENLDTQYGGIWNN